MIAQKELLLLKNHNNLPRELSIPNIDIILECIYTNKLYILCKTIEELDIVQSNEKIDISFYTDTIRPIIKCLFDLNKSNTKSSSETNSNISYIQNNELSVYSCPLFRHGWQFLTMLSHC